MVWFCIGLINMYVCVCKNIKICDFRQCICNYKNYLDFISYKIYYFLRENEVIRIFFGMIIVVCYLLF